MQRGKADIGALAFALGVARLDGRDLLVIQRPAHGDGAHHQAHVARDALDGAHHFGLYLVLHVRIAAQVGGIDLTDDVLDHPVA